MTCQDDSRYVSCISTCDENEVLKRIEKATKPLATNDVIVNTSGVKRLRILRRHHTEPVLKKTSVGGAPLPKQFSKLGAKRQARMKKDKQMLTVPLSNDDPGGQGSTNDSRENQRSHLIEPPIWLLAEEDFDASANSGNVFQGNVSNRSSQTPSPLPGAVQFVFGRDSIS